MKGTKIIGACLVVVFALFLVVPVASAQPYPEILDGQWFRVKASMKGYMIADDGSMSKGSGGATDYIKFTYDAGTYTLLTCAQDDENPGLWHKTISRVSGDPGDGLPIPRNNISIQDTHGAVYPLIWDFGEVPIVFYDGQSIYALYPVLYMKITAAGPVLSKASISALSCTLRARMEDLGEYFDGIGSCGLSGSLIPPDQVEKKVPEQCRR